MPSPAPLWNAFRGQSCRGRQRRLGHVPPSLIFSAKVSFFPRKTRFELQKSSVSMDTELFMLQKVLLTSARPWRRPLPACFFSASASSLDTPSFRVLGAPSTAALASARPRPVISRTALMTLILAAASKPVRTTSNSVFSSAAGAAAPAAGAAIAAAETPNSSSRA